MTSVAAGAAAIAGRAAFLACSWTWCIGMWFPVYMVRDWGWPGWAAFLVPNAIGAAAVGFVHTASGSRRFVAANLRAMRAFSIVTILFHVSWLAWLMPLLASQSAIHQGWVGGAIAAAVVLAAWWISMMRKGWSLFALVTLAASAGAWIACGATGPTLVVPPESGSQPPIGLVHAIPMLVLGFGLCPHLDATFHRVRQEAPGVSGAAAFAIAFGAVFPALMLFSLLYAGGLNTRAWNYYVVVHLVLQAAFTIAAHARELRPGGIVSWGVWWRRGRWVLMAAMVLMFAGAVAPWLPRYAPQKSAHRLLYELWLSWYALVFPAYAWIVAVERGLPMRARVRSWIAACALAGPCLWIGYIEQRHAWLLPAVGIVLLAPIVARILFTRGRR